MGSGYRYGKVRAETERIAMSAALIDQKNTGWAKLWPDIVEMFTDGNRLAQTEEEWLEEWLKESGFEDIDLEDVQTVQLSLDWMADQLNSKNGAVLALRKLQNIGLIQLIHKGKKGHSSLYCVRPFPPSGLSPP